MSEKKPLRNGKPASTLTVRSSANEAKKRARLERLLAAVYNQYQRLDDPAVNAICRKDFAFHMTDWIDDLTELTSLYQHPEQFDREQAGDIVGGFLIHVTAHVMEAARLLLDSEPGYIFDSPKPKKTQPPIKPARHSARPAQSP